MKKISLAKRKAAGAFLLAALMISGLVFTACGKKTETVTQPAEETAEVAETAGAEATQTRAAQEGTEETGSTQETGSTEESGTFDMASEEIPMAVSGTYDGIVVDAAMNSLVIDTAEGMMYAVSLPETEDVVETSDGILLGQAVTVTCEDGVASSITDCAVKPAADREALAFAADILFACKYRDINSLSSLAGYPLYVNLGDEDQTIENGGDLLKLPVSEVLSDERVKAVLSTNLFEVKELSGGKYVLGAEEGRPNIIFQKDEGRDSGFAITGIN